MWTPPIWLNFLERSWRLFTTLTKCDFQWIFCIICFMTGRRPPILNPLRTEHDEQFGMCAHNGKLEIRFIFACWISQPYVASVLLKNTGWNSNDKQRYRQMIYVRIKHNKNCSEMCVCMVKRANFYANEKWPKLDSRLVDRDITSSTAHAYNGFVRAFNYGYRPWNTMNYLNSCFMPRNCFAATNLFFYVNWK